MPPPRLTRRTDPIVTRVRDVARGLTDDHEVVLLDGPHVVLEALRADLPIELVIASDAMLDAQTPEMRQLWSLAGASGAAIYSAASTVIDAVSPVRSPTGIVALARWSAGPVEALWSPAPALVLGAVDVQDPGNAGALIRCADGLDATGVAMIGQTADPGSWKALRGAMGSTFRVPVARTDLGHLLDEARNAGVHIVATASPTTPHALELRALDLTRPTLLLLGNEGAGLNEQIRAMADTTVYVAMRPGLDSFNVSVTAGLLLYEARRQRA